MKTKLPLTLPKLRKKADRMFSRKRRQEEKDKFGNAICITCGCRRYWQELDAGHFIQREHLATRYEKDNVWPQCVKCNRFKGGRYSIYRDNLIEKIGREKVEWLEHKKYETVIFARSFYEQVIDDCKDGTR